MPDLGTESGKGLGCMEKIKCTISYDGTHFSGYQIQPNTRTIQGEFEQALGRMHKGKQVEVYGSGRTDRGVHAKGQTLHFETSLMIPEKGWKQALNTLLPPDVHVIKVEKVPAAFHARFDVTCKEYRYYICMESETDVFKRNYVYKFPVALDLKEMQRACGYLEGEHDFTTLSSAKATTTGSKVRTVYHVSCEKHGNEIEFIFCGNGFLYHMVRILVGTLLDVGQGKIKADSLPWLFEQKDRQLAGDTVPPQGLYLWKVRY